MPHIHEKIDFTAETFIVHKNKVLLRMHDKYKIWLAPGGHIELDEDPAEAAIREAKEEVGLDIVLKGSLPQIKNLDPNYKPVLAPRYMNRHYVNPGASPHEHISMYYFATSETDQVMASGDDRSDEWKWFAMEELSDPQYGIREDIQFYAREALREIGDPQ